MDWYEEYYDEFIEQICPDYNKALHILVNNIPDVEEIVELGCGTGNLTKLLGEKLPEANIFAYDNDKNRLNKARAKLSNFKNINFIYQDIFNIELNKDDVVVSSLLFHLLKPEERKKNFQKLCDSKVKEIYVFDRLKGKTFKEEKKHQEYFRDNLIRNKFPKDFINVLVKENMETNNPDRLSEQKEFFEQRGYSLDILYRNPNHGFMVYQIKKQNSK